METEELGKILGERVALVENKHRDPVPDACLFHPLFSECLRGMNRLQHLTSTELPIL